MAQVQKMYATAGTLRSSACVESGQAAFGGKLREVLLVLDMLTHPLPMHLYMVF